MTEEAKRLRNETPDEYRIRLYKNQEAYGLSNTEIGDLLNEVYGVSYDESAWRKKTRPYIQGYEDGLKANESSAEILNEIKKERIKLQTLNVERNRVNRQEARHELFYEQIADRIQTIKDIDIPEVNITKNQNKEYVLTLADIHYGYVFESINNSQSPSIAEERMMQLAKNVCSYCLENNVSKLNIINLGDNIHGILRVSDLQANQSGIVTATIEVANLLGKFLEVIAQNIPSVLYYHVPESNHTQIRPLGTKASELFTEDVEYIITEFLKVKFKDIEGISIVTGKLGESFIPVPIYDQFVLAKHGHDIKNIETAIKDLAYTIGVDVDYLFLGHFHNSREISVGIADTLYSKFDRKTFLCPSIMGSDTYSDKILKGSCPGANLYIFDNKHGHIGTMQFVM